MHNGDFRPFGARVSLFRSDALQPSPAAETGKSLAKRQNGTAVGDSAYSALNNGERQFEQEMAGSAEAAVEPVSGEGGVKGGEWGVFTFFVFSRRTQRSGKGPFGRDFA
jgi:hypothetical protein